MNEVALKQFMKWFFINQFLGFAYLILLFSSLFNNLVFIFIFGFIFGVGVLITWYKMTINSFRIWKSVS